MGKRPRTPHFITGIGDGHVNLADSKNNAHAPNDDIFLLGNSGTGSANIAEDRYYIRSRNERLARLEQPLLASDHFRDVFSGDPALGKPSYVISGPWQVSAFALLGLAVIMSAICLHMVSENQSESSNSPYSYRRRQRQARSRYKTRKKKTDEWSDDEEDVLQNGFGLPDHDATGGVTSSPGEDKHLYPYYYPQESSGVASVTTGFTAQEHRHRRSGNSGPYTPPSASGHSNYYMPVNPAYKSPSASGMNKSVVHRRGFSPRNSFSSNKSSGQSPGPTSIVTGYPSSAGHAFSPSNIMRATAPISGRLRVPTTPDGRDLFPAVDRYHSMPSGSHGFHGLQPMLPPPPEESRLPAQAAQSLSQSHLLPNAGNHELGTRPIDSSNFSSFASMESPGDEHGQSSTSHTSHERGAIQPNSDGSFRLGQLLSQQAEETNSHNSQYVLHESHHQSLLLSPGNHEAKTPQVVNRRRLFDPNSFGVAIPNLGSALQLPNDDGEGPIMPFIPTLRTSLDDPIEGRLPLLYAAARPPRSVLMDELRLVQMETGNSTHWGIQDTSEYQDVSESQESFHDQEYEELQGKKIFQFDDDSQSEQGSDISIPSGDPRKGIIHKRVNLLKDTDAYSSLQSNVEFEELDLKEVIGGGGFGQVWRASWRGTPVAVKVLTGSAQNAHIAKPILEEFKAEINLLSGMRHPNICLYMGACLRPPNRAIVTELAANGSVWDALRLPLSPPYLPADGTARSSWPESLYIPDQHGAPPSDLGTPPMTVPIPPKGTWPWDLVKRVAYGAAGAMTYLHSGKPPVLHRDLKSANLLLDDSYTAKVCDFGLSRLKAQARSMTGNCGTVQWMAPEVLGNMEYDEKADVFSYGIILWELLSRECPYEGMTAIQCALAVLNRDKRPEIPKWCPPAFHALIKACVKKDQRQRPTFPEILVALDAMKA